MGTAYVLFTDQNLELPSIINFLSLEVFTVAWMRFSSSGIWRCVNGWAVTNVSKEYSASRFKDL